MFMLSNLRFTQAQNELKIESELAKDHRDSQHSDFFWIQRQRAKATVQNLLKYGGFHDWGTPKWMVKNGQSY